MCRYTLWHWVTKPGQITTGRPPCTGRVSLPQSDSDSAAEWQGPALSLGDCDSSWRRALTGAKFSLGRVAPCESWWWCESESNLKDESRVVWRSIWILQLAVAASNLRRNHSLWHRWSSGRIRPCHGRDPGSIPGRCSDPTTEPSIIFDLSLVNSHCYSWRLSFFFLAERLTFTACSVIFFGGYAGSYHASWYDWLQRASLSRAASVQLSEALHYQYLNVKQLEAWNQWLIILILLGSSWDAAPSESESSRGEAQRLADRTSESDGRGWGPAGPWPV